MANLKPISISEVDLRCSAFTDDTTYGSNMACKSIEDTLFTVFVNMCSGNFLGNAKGFLHLYHSGGKFCSGSQNSGIASINSMGQNRLKVLSTLLQSK
jgi:hypothetical protein